LLAFLAPLHLPPKRKTALLSCLANSKASRLLLVCRCFTVRHS
jgi:hypothetical protein